jgi:sugar (pentulose or hexulose) kinase
MAYRLTGRHVLGIGDAAGMFPVDPDTHNYDASLLQIYNQLLQAEHVKDAANNGGQQDDQHHPLLLPTKLENLLPTIRRAGQDAGNLMAQGAALLGLPFDNETTVIPVAAGEGDQVAALAGSLIGKPGTVSCSFGTSVCANLVGDHGRLLHVSAAVDHFCSANGKPIHMVWLRNGTTFLNTMVQSYGSVLKTQRQDGDCSSTITSVVDAFDTIMPALVAAAPDCGGLIALPFMDDEPGLGVGVAGLVQAAEGGGGNSSSSSSSSSTAVILGWTATNATPGNVCKAALLSTIFNLKSGCQVVQSAGNVMNEIVLSGGLTKTPDCGQILADVFNLPVRLLESSEEGCSWGACVLASYRYFRKMNQKDDNHNTNDDADDDNVDDWPTFLAALAEKRPPEIVFQPSAQSVEQYSIMYRKYQKLMNLEPQLRNVVSST